MTAQHAMIYIEAKELLKNKWIGEDFNGDQTSHTQQNN